MSDVLIFLRNQWILDILIPPTFAAGVVTFGIAVAQLASHPHRWLAAPIDCPMQGSFSTVSPLSV